MCIDLVIAAEEQRRLCPAWAANRWAALAAPGFLSLSSVGAVVAQGDGHGEQDGDEADQQ
jgi:hypothetical protein